jgi:hypothetical protein
LFWAYPRATQPRYTTTPCSSGSGYPLYLCWLKEPPAKDAIPIPYAKVEVEIWDLEFRIWDLRFAIWDLGFGILQIAFLQKNFIFFLRKKEYIWETIL